MVSGNQKYEQTDFGICDWHFGKFCTFFRGSHIGMDIFFQFVGQTLNEVKVYWIETSTRLRHLKSLVGTRRKKSGLRGHYHVHSVSSSDHNKIFRYNCIVRKDVIDISRLRFCFSLRSCLISELW